MSIKCTHPLEVPDQATTSQSRSTDTSTCVIDLSQPYKYLCYQTDEAKQMMALSEGDENVHSFIALECGKVIAEYYEGEDTQDLLHLFSALG